MSDHTTHTPAGRGPHQLMLGTVTVSRLLGAEETGGALSLVELSGVPGSGPGPHLDPWQESFYVLAGELTFRHERDGAVHTLVAGPGDAVSIPADAGEAIERPDLPAEPPPADRERLLAAFAAHRLTPYDFPLSRAGRASA
jgi:quercetin dioxygenase-like cupin family protein